MSPVATPLAKRLAAYSAAAGVTLAIAPTAAAQVAYTDVDPDAASSTSAAINLDFDNDGTVDVQLGFSSGGEDTQGRILFLGAASGTGALGVDAPYFGNSAFGSAYKLDPGDTVGPNDMFFQAGVLGSIYNNNPYYNFLGGEGYVGFQFVAGTGATHYGWARIAVNSDATVATIYEYAFEQTAGTAITVGDTGGTSVDPSELADGYRFSPVAPNPVAGLSRFDVAVGQTESVRVEVFDALGRSVDVLHDGPLAGGTAREFELRSGDLPAGVYVVRVKGESFDTTRTVTVIR